MGLKVPKRIIITIVIFLCTTALFAMRVCLNLLINEMIRDKTLDDTEHICKSSEDPEEPIYKLALGSEIADPKWTETEQSFIRAAFYMGYVPGHIPAGACADKFGARWVVISCLIISSLFTIVLPPVMVFNSHWFLVGFTRIMVGFGQSLICPAASSLITRWVPIEERGILGSLAFSGSEMGSVLGAAISALLAHWGGWAVPFYFMGFWGFLLAVVSYFTIYTRPKDHPTITPEELEKLAMYDVPRAQIKIPYKYILTDFKIWALGFAEFGHTIIFFIFNTDLPKYFAQVLHFDIKSNGLLSAIPPLGLWVCSCLTAVLTDWLYYQKHITIKTLRRWNSIIGNIIPALLCVAAGYIGCQRVWAVIVLTLSLTMKGPVYSGLKINFLDLTKNYGGFVIALQNGFGCLSGILQPYLVGLIAPNKLLAEWRRVFWVCAIIVIIPTVIYTITTSDKRRKWDYQEGEEIPEDA